MGRLREVAAEYDARIDADLESEESRIESGSEIAQVTYSTG
jgi:hypothetical protein